MKISDEQLKADTLALIKQYGASLTPSQLAVLKSMRDNDNGEDGELVCGGQKCWIGSRSVGRSVETALLLACAISEDSFSDGDCRRYTINSTGRDILSALEAR